MCVGGDGPRALDDADDFVADAAPSVVHFVFEDVDALDEERARVVYDLFCFFNLKILPTRKKRARTLRVPLRPIIVLCRGRRVTVRD